jgi:hypothetical protein
MLKNGNEKFQGDKRSRVKLVVVYFAVREMSFLKINRSIPFQEGNGTLFTILGSRIQESLLDIDFKKTSSFF